MLSIICKLKCPPIFDVGPAGVLEARRNAQSRVEVEDFMRLRSLTMAGTIRHVRYTRRSSASCLSQDECTSN